jgi:hypothetical protein
VSAQDGIRTRAVLAVERGMPLALRKAILARFRHSSLNGAAVADILDILDNHDYLLQYREPFYEDDQPTQVRQILDWPPEEDALADHLRNRVIGYSVMAVALLDNTIPDPQDVATLALAAWNTLEES